ncbi:hypothetical protein GMOD_00003053 [Pyrenophora seminiperda CCB06]|uniref:Uncharacterized protein n=1 Tax=Pyrenophora seminiperda CCB06 TaxID=1302712 RepID=A0A3M7M409_9PLEO|nr:hypothetical protein GMOD_00003053 [Pyrenophora seminiperda CCB06]
MSLTTLPSLPDPILHLICIHLTPDRPTVNDHTHGQSPTLYRPIINLSLTAHCLNRISSAHIATNISLTDACTRWNLFLRTVAANPTYASHVKYLKFSNGTPESDALTETTCEAEERDGSSLRKMLKVLPGLEVLYSSHHHGRGVEYAPATILQYLTSGGELPLWKTLQTVRFDHINAWHENEVVQINLLRGDNSAKTTGTHLLTGDLEDLNVTELCEKIPGVVGVQVATKLFQDADAVTDEEEADADWIDEDEEDEEESDWSEQDYEEDSEESDWDSEDDSDYEDDWEAEYGFTVPKAEPVKHVNVDDAAPPVVGVPARGASLLDF